jgi:hypothetical protein
LRFCLSDLVRMKGVPAARGRHDFGLDLGEQTLNAKGAGLHGCWSSRAQRLFCREQPGRRSRPQSLDRPLPTKDGGILRTIRDACNYMTGIGKQRELRSHWQRACKLILAKEDVLTVSRC